MASQKYWIFALLGPATAYAFIAISIALSPWFSWGSNALSDLGHATRSDVAVYYNLGLFLGGFFLIAYGLLGLRTKKPWTAVSLIIAGLALQAVGVFDEVYGDPHSWASVAIFLMLWVTMAVYTWEGRSFVALALFLVYVPQWVLWWLDIYGGGVAIPETLSSATATLWLVYVVGREDLGLWGKRG